MGAFDHLEWTYDEAFEQLFGLRSVEFEQKFSKNARGVARGGMLKLLSDWYIMSTRISRSEIHQGTGASFKILTNR